jgi:predicted phage terminase large subunit-like protein
VIDDPIKGREEADSEVIRQRTHEAYEDDLLTRLIPGGWVVLIQTRWHEDDLAGRILPHDWTGQSGDIACRDGNTWRVLCLQAECQHPGDDPLGRKAGEMLWPEWFDDRHWAQFRGNRRTWSSLYQQVPAPAEGILFRRDDMGAYDVAPELRIIGGSDFAVTADGGDWTEHGIAGLDHEDGTYLRDWWRGQTGPEVWIERMVDMMARWQPLAWYVESGPIWRSIEGQLRRRMAQRRVSCRLESMPSVSDKPTRAQPIIATAGMGRLYWPRAAAWVPELQRQCLVFPAGSPDDGVDTLSIIGRGAATLGRMRKPIKLDIPQVPMGAHGWMA